MQSINPFPYIFKDSYNFQFNDWKWRADECLEHAAELKRPGPEKNGGVTSVVINNHCPPHSWDEMQPFLEWMYPKINQIWDAWKLEPMNKHLSDSWINIHPPGAWTAEHHHQNVIVAVVCYLQVPENSGGLRVKNPFRLQKYSEPVRHEYYDDDGEWEVVNVKTNDVLFIPGWLSHMTEVNNSKDDRYVVSMNIMGTFL